ncbi:MAG: glycosyltransferase family 9 protein [Arcobacter butzleri]|nr:glycosyltransferase family 9 protein [Aliarcobacter butzleri]
MDSVESFNKDELYKNSDFVDIKTQLKVNKKDINIAIIGGVGRDIGEMINGLNALRILYKVLQKKYKNIKIDLLLESAQNQYYKRDKEFLEKDSTINQVLPLCIKLNKFMEYDYYIDNSLIYETTFYKELNYIDAYLYKFGIDSTKTDQHLKYNYYDMSFYQVPQELKNELDKIKKQSKIVLFHPFTPKADRSIPKDIANSFLKELISISDYSIVSALKIDKIENDKFFDLSRYSKSLFDFIYIISQADYIITADTSTYHISDMFLIPTVSIFSDEELAQKRLKYYQSTKAYILKEEKRNLSLLRFDNELLTINKYSKYKSLKAKKVLKLLNTIYQ